MIWLLLVPGCRLLRPSTVGVGPGGLLIPEGGEVVARGSVVMESRSLPPEDQLIGFVSRGTYTFHDAAATSRMWRWYLEGPDDPGLDLLWYTFLFPSLVVAPMVGGDYGQGYGIIVQPAPHLPYAEVGLQGSLWLRPSSPDLKFDVNLGIWMGLGIRLGDTLDLALRTSVGTPVFHTLSGQPGRVISSGLLLSMRRKPLLRQRRPTQPEWEEETEEDDAGEDDTGATEDTG